MTLDTATPEELDSADIGICTTYCVLDGCSTDASVVPLTGPAGMFTRATSTPLTYTITPWLVHSRRDAVPVAPSGLRYEKLERNRVTTDALGADTVVRSVAAP